MVGAENAKIASLEHTNILKEIENITLKVKRRKGMIIDNGCTFERAINNTR
jgi:hypothetical protein